MAALLWLSIKPARSCAYTNISDTIDGVIPNVLPLVAVFAIYFYMQKKGPRYNRILLAIIVISFICAALGIL